MRKIDIFEPRGNDHVNKKININFCCCSANIFTIYLLRHCENLFFIVIIVIYPDEKVQIDFFGEKSFLEGFFAIFLVEKV